MRISSIYSAFGWIHTDGKKLPCIVGTLASAVMKLAKPQLFQKEKNFFSEYSEKMSDAASRRVSWEYYLGCKLVYGVSVEEFYSYDFPKKNDLGRREYITQIGRFAYYKALNGRYELETYENKYKTYVLYRDYFQREAMLWNGPEDNDALLDFIGLHGRVIAKPLTAYMGHGIRILDVGEMDREIIISHVLEMGECILEELIVQSQEMSEFHPASVNTIRIPAFSVEGKTVINRPFMKIGRGDSVVDNGGSGGMFAAIDKESGIVISCGITENGERFIFHPDTQKQIIGFQLPDWESVKQLTEELMLVNPKARYIGWDFAHTDHGWVLVEANETGQFVGQQMAFGNGCKREVDSLLDVQDRI